MADSNPNSIMAMDPQAFMAALDEWGIQGDERDRLVGMYRDQTASGQVASGLRSDVGEGMVRRNILPFAAPQGMTGAEALMSGDFEWAVPGMISSLYQIPADAFEAYDASTSGLPVSDEEFNQRMMDLGSIMTGSNVMANTARGIRSLPAAESAPPIPAPAPQNKWLQALSGQEVSAPTSLPPPPPTIFTPGVEFPQRPQQPYNPIGPRAGTGPARPSDQKAEALGFNDTVYHSTLSPTEFTQFDLSKQITGGSGRSFQDYLGVHVGTAKAASDRNLGASQEARLVDPQGHTMELRARTDNPLTKEKVAEMFGVPVKQFFKKADGPFQEQDFAMLQNEYANELLGTMPDLARRYDENTIPPPLVAAYLRKDLADKGFTHIPYINRVEDRGSTSFIMLTDRDGRSPAVLRDVRAGFDPSKINDPDLRFSDGGEVDDVGYAEGGPIENLRVVGNSVYRVAPDGRMFFVRSLAPDPTANTDVFAATPPPAENIAGYYGTTPVGTFLDKMTEGRPSGPEPYFGEAAVGMAAPYLENAYNLASTATTMTPDPNSYAPEAIQRMGHYAKNMGLAGLSAVMAPVYGAAGLAGDVANSVGIPNADALVRDLGAMLDVSGVLPEGRILGAMADAGTVGQVAGNAKRAVNAAVEKAPVVYADAIGNARALAQSDLEFMRGRGLPENAVGVGADVPKAPGIGDNGGPALDNIFEDNVFETPPSAPAPRQRYVDPTTGRYSKAFEAAQDLTQNVMTPAQARAGLIKQGVSEEELLYTGFDSWLKGKDKVTKDEVVNILADVAINKSGEGSLPFKRITHESTGITGGEAGQKLEDLRWQVLQDRMITASDFVEDYRTALRNDLESQGFQRISAVKTPEDLQNLQALYADAVSKGGYFDPKIHTRLDRVQELLDRGEDFYSDAVRRKRLMLNDEIKDAYVAPDGSVLPEHAAFTDYLPNQEHPDDMWGRMEYELTNAVEQMDEQQVADYLGLDVNDFITTFAPGTTEYSGYGPKGLMDYRENRYGYEDTGRGVLSGSEYELGTQSYREGHFSKGSQDENRMYHTRVGMLNTPEGKAYHAFEFQSDVGQSYRNDPSKFHITGTSPTFEIPKASKKALQDYVTVGKKYQSLKEQEDAAMNVLYSDQYLDPKTGRLLKGAPGYEDLVSNLRNIRAQRDAVSQQLLDIEKANNDVIDGMQRFYGRPGMSIRTADAYGQDFDIKAVEEALAGGLKPKSGAGGSPKGKISTRPFTTSTNRWVPAALKDELFNAANSDAEWFSLPLGKDVKSWTYGESAGQADFYENIVPTQLKKLLKKEYGLDVPIEKIKAEGFLKRDNPTYEVNAIRLTPELKKMILEQGFSTFKKGGPVEGSTLSDVDVFALP